ncbi:MAG: phenylacetate-CoA oxygenase/reductase subunit PaaK [Actinomycetota bacterium]|nr:phenylacetate-CoA oxygenase/reductase subunit PaaK [Actinomycetota bacterium]
MPSPSRHAVFHPLRVAAVDRLTDDAVAITFEVPEELREEFRFLPGQHLSVRSPALGDDIRRSYSVCAPATSGPLRIAVKRIPDGTFSTYAAERLHAGDVVDVMTPTGSFATPMDPGQAKRYAAIAAGSGITPVLSILSTALEVEQDSTAVLLYVNRTTGSIMFLEELEDLKNRYSERFELVHVLDEEPVEVEILSGRLDAARLARILDTLVPVDEVDEWFLCGPLPMTDAARGVLLERGADPAHVHRELFHVSPPSAGARRAAPAPDAATATGSAVTVVLDGRSHSFPLPRDGASVLDATLRVRPDAPYACKNGVCGTCRAQVVQGEVEMDANYALESEELARGFVLTCQAHPVSERVTVDFDR